MRLAHGFIAMLLIAQGLAISACSVIYPLEDQTDRWQAVGSPKEPVRLAYREEGHGKPVLLIHGLGTNSYSWRHLWPVLAKDHRVISVDLKGFGRSDKPFDDFYSVSDQARLVSQFMENMALRDVTVVGHSFGGGVALMMALDRRSGAAGRIKRLVLLNSIAYPQKIPSFFKVLRTPVLGHLGATATLPELQTKAALMLAYHDDSKSAAEMLPPIRGRSTRRAANTHWCARHSKSCPTTCRLSPGAIAPFASPYSLSGASTTRSCPLPLVFGCTRPCRIRSSIPSISAATFRMKSSRRRPRVRYRNSCIGRVFGERLATRSPSQPPIRVPSGWLGGGAGGTVLQ